MGYQERRDLVDECATNIIAQQYEDRVKYGFDNHFLSDVIQKIMLKSAPRLLETVEYLGTYAKDVDDKHSLRMKMHLNNKKKVVFSIKDETTYGPNMDRVLIINDIENGKLHIRELKKASDIKDYQKNKWEVFGNSFVSRGFIYTFEYLDQFSLDMARKYPQDAEMYLEDSKKLTKAWETNDLTFPTYERFNYAAGLCISIMNTIEMRKNELEK